MSIIVHHVRNRLFRTAAIMGLILAASIAGGCDSSVSVPDPELESPLGLQWVEAFRKSGETTRTASTDEIDVGAFGRGRDYYFMITNRGSSPVHDVRATLEADSAFALTPGNVSTVPPGVDANVLPMLRLSITHGTSTEGLSGLPLLEPGFHTATINLEGDIWSEDSAVVETVSLTRPIRLTALVTDVTFYDTEGEIDVRRPEGGILSGGFEAPGFVRVYTKSGRLDVINTGNVPVGVKHFPRSLQNIPDERILSPGDTLVMPADSTGWIRVGQGSAIRDPFKLRLFSNGFSYFFFQNPDNE